MNEWLRGGGGMAVVKFLLTPGSSGGEGGEACRAPQATEHIYISIATHFWFCNSKTEVIVIML